MATSGYKIAGIYIKNTIHVFEPLSCFSRVLTKSEMRQSSRTREIYASSYSIKNFGFHLIGIEFTVSTDHYSLKWLMSSFKSNDLTQRLFNIFFVQNHF